MKQVFLIIAIVALSNSLFAQSEKYKAAMKNNISMLDSMMSKRNAGELANNFERIGDAEKTQWLPYYYASYTTLMNGFTEPDKSKTDAIADKAEQLINKAESILGKENSETDVIKSMIASAHMMVDPQSRYMQYGPASSGNIDKAIQLDPTNPRPVYLQGQAKFYTPPAFGGGKDQAKVLFEKSIAMFDKFKPETDLSPNWGKNSAQYFLAMCK